VKLLWCCVSGRLTLVLFLWLVCVPVGTAWTFRLFFLALMRDQLEEAKQVARNFSALAGKGCEGWFWLDSC